MSDIRTTLNACELIWRQHSMADSQIADMRTELEAHLRDAEREGKAPESVVGPDIGAFARSWADVDRRFDPASADDRAAEQAERAERAERTRSRLLTVLGTVVALTAIAAILGPRGDAADLESWQWVFVIATFTLLVGELLTGGFFVLPFAIGSLSATILAFARVEPAVIIIVFLVVSVICLWGLHQFASKDDQTVVPVGANRYVGQHAVVTSGIDGLGTVGRVRVETEDWMAVTDGNERIAAGTVVTVAAVRGARLVVTSR